MLNVRKVSIETPLFDGCSSLLSVSRDIRSLLLAASLLCSMTPAKAEYRLHVGDVLEISVATLPELKQRVSVQMDGTISYPLLGTIAAADLSLAEIEAKVQATLAAKVFRQRTGNSVGIEPDEVTTTIVEYRPIFINGDVAKPGQQVYLPLMTVRQAVALSGGYDVARLRMNNPILETADLQSEYESLWIEYAREQALVWRLKQELGQDTTLDEKALLDVPIARSMAKAIVNIEAEALKADQADDVAERTFLQRGIAQADEQLQILSERRKAEDDAAQADAEDFQRIKDLYNRGTLPILRVSDARRAMLLSSTQRLQTMAQLMQAKRQQDDLSRQIQRLDGKRRSDLLRALQDATVTLSKVRSKLQSIGEKLQYTALAKSQLASGFGNKPAITIVRSATKGIQHLVANEDSELQPGDVVEVALQDVRGADDSGSREAPASGNSSKSEAGQNARQQTQTAP